jgi:hypothetical protein
VTRSIRRIGLSLGADVCWPLCFEGILDRLRLDLPIGSERIRFEVERVTIEPFDLAKPCPYDLVVDRLTHWYSTSREWIKKAVILDGLYVLNNPWSVQSMEKQTTYCAMMRLGLPVPRTWLVPPKEYQPSADLERTLTSYARLFDLGEVGRELGYPMFMKPYDGGGWVGVSRIDSEEALRAAYEQSGTHVMHLQRAVDGWDRFVRCVGVGPQVLQVRYDPSAALHDRYVPGPSGLDDDAASRLENLTLVINAFFGWDFNSCESLHNADGWHLIDFANPCPDSQVTSLHWHFPRLVAAIIRWSVYCAAVRRPMRLNLDWSPFLEVAYRGATFDERMAGYAAVARERLDADAFAEFTAEHLSHLDEVVWEFFGSEAARDAIRRKVETMYPSQEVDEFTDLFWQRIQRWRDAESRS